MEKDTIIWKFQGWSNFGFFIPEERDLYGWDFYVNKKNFNWANDWDKVEARQVKYTKWKKPEVKIINVLSGENEVKKKDIKKEYIEWIYSGWDWNFGFIDVEWMEKWFFVYWNKKGEAKDWDRVKAEIIDFKWKKEAIVMKVYETKKEVIIWKYRDNDRFWFVVAEDWSKDIFIAWSRKNWAKNLDRVEVEIIKEWGKNPEGVIIKILN